jgi:hypothetical protein
MRTYDVRILSVDTFVKMIKGIAPRKSLLFRNIVHKHKWSPNASESTETDSLHGCCQAGHTKAKISSDFPYAKNFRGGH